LSRRTIAWLLSGIVSAAAVLAQAGQPAQAPRASGLIAGRVVDSSGGAIAGAVVVIRADSPGQPPPRPGTGPTPVRTNAEGRFVFTDVPPGNYQVEATKPGWLPGAFGRRRPGGPALPVLLTESLHRNDVSITMRRPAVIGGFVTADNGDPLVGVEVRAVQLMYVAGRRQIFDPQSLNTSARQKTDDRGAYRFSDLTPGDYVVAVLASVLSEPPGFDGAMRAAGSTPQSYYQTMTAMGAAPIVFNRATGVAAGGRALVGSLSGLSGVPATEGAWLTYPTTYYPSALTQNAATIISAVSGEPQTGINVDVRMVPTFQVSGLLTGPEGPAPWHAVHLVHADTGDVPLVDVATAVTDAEGRFTFFGVPSGQYVARVIRVPPPSAPWRMGLAGGTGAIPRVATFGGGPSSGPPTSANEPLLHANADVTVADRHLTTVGLTLAEGPRVRGRLVLEGSGPPPTAEMWKTATVWAAAANGREDSSIFPSPLSGEGAFVTPAVWPGKYLLRVNPPRGWTLLRANYQGRDISSSAVDITADLENVVITLTNRTRTLKGAVQVESGSRGSDAVVLMFPVEPEGWTDFGRVSRTITSSRAADDGSFTLPAPPDGEYYVVAIPDEESDDWQRPATLAKLAGLADRFRMQGDGASALSLRLRRLQ
jgi:protocatechuate 3,4-dioxygenase beta subunit